MNVALRSRSWIAVRAWMLALGGIVSLAFGVRDGYAQAESTPSTSPPVGVSLAYQEAKVGVANWSLSVTPQSGAFKQEPAVSASDARRGRISFGMRGEQPMAFIWDSTRGRLHLDLNRNEDLTDDTNGVFTSREKSLAGGRYQNFTDVRLSLPTDAGPYPLLLDLNLTAYGAVRATASLRSFYSGKVTLQERDWQIGLVDKPSGQPGALLDASMLLRPWESRDQAFQTESGVMDAFRFATNLFFQGRAYRLQGECDSRATPVCYRVQLTEQPAALGEVQFTGQFIRRAMLKDGPWTAVLDEPSGTVRVPVGSYGAYQVQVQKGEAGACLDVWPADRGISKKIVVAEGKPVTLTAGGPLNNTVVVNRRGHSLVFSYRLVGAGGEQYRLLHQDRSKPPRFAVYKGDKQIASGNFEFG